MKVAFLTSEYPHPYVGNSGGIGTSISNLAQGLVQLGHEVILLIYGQKEDTFFQENGIDFYLIKNVKVKGFSRFITQKKIEKLINKLVKNKKIDVLEAADWTGITSNIKPQCPIVVKLHGSDTYFCHLDHRPVKWINRFHEKRALKKADALISVSQFTADLTNKIFKLKRAITIIPNCLNITSFELLPKNAPETNHTILYFGTLIRKKGLFEIPLIFNEVYKQNPDAKLILAGKDSADILTGSSSTFNLMQVLFDTQAIKNVNYIGNVPYQEIKDLIQQASVCIFPSFAEALPVSWIEAMAMQKPIVASNIGWANEIIDDDINGFLVYPKNHLAYANTIIQLLEDKEKREKMGIQARKKVENQFSIEIVAAKSVAFYQSVIDAKGQQYIR